MGRTAKSALHRDCEDSTTLESGVSSAGVNQTVTRAGRAIWRMQVVEVRMPSKTRRVTDQTVVGAYGPWRKRTTVKQNDFCQRVRGHRGVVDSDHDTWQHYKLEGVCDGWVRLRGLPLA